MAKTTDKKKKKRQTEDMEGKKLVMSGRVPDKRGY